MISRARSTQIDTHQYDLLALRDDLNDFLSSVASARQVEHERVVLWTDLFAVFPDYNNGWTSSLRLKWWDLFLQFIDVAEGRKYFCPGCRRWLPHAAFQPSEWRRDNRALYCIECFDSAFDTKPAHLSTTIGPPSYRKGPGTPKYYTPTASELDVEWPSPYLELQLTLVLRAVEQGNHSAKQIAAATGLDSKLVDCLLTELILHRQQLRSEQRGSNLRLFYLKQNSAKGLLPA